MKKLFLAAIGLLISLGVYSQAGPTQVYRIQSDVTVYGRSISKGSQIVDTQTGRVFVAMSSLLSTQTLSTSDVQQIVGVTDHDGVTLVTNGNSSNYVSITDQELTFETIDYNDLANTPTEHWTASGTGIEYSGDSVRITDRLLFGPDYDIYFYTADITGNQVLYLIHEAPGGFWWDIYGSIDMYSGDGNANFYMDETGTIDMWNYNNYAGIRIGDGFVRAGSEEGVFLVEYSGGNIYMNLTGSDATRGAAAPGIRYNPTTDKLEFQNHYGTGWNAFDDIGGALTLPGLADVDDATTFTSGHYLRGSGSTWVNSAILDADIPSTIARDTEIPATTDNLTEGTTNLYSQWEDDGSNGILWYDPTYAAYHNFNPSATAFYQIGDPYTGAVELSNASMYFGIQDASADLSGLLATPNDVRIKHTMGASNAELIVTNTSFGYTYGGSYIFRANTTDLEIWNRDLTVNNAGSPIAGFGYSAGNVYGKYLGLTPGTAPTGSEGILYANSTDHKLYFHNGTGYVDLTGNESITLSGDVSGTGTTAITTTLGTDVVDDTHINWGTSAGQVAGGDIPIVDAGGYFDVDEVETALQELGADIASGGDNWGSQVIVSDAPLSGDGTAASHLVISQATTSTNGYLSSTDWNTFNNKVSNATHTGDVTGDVALTIGSDKILESMLKAVNTPTDEYVLTYEETTGDFEWQQASTGSDGYLSAISTTDLANVDFTVTGASDILDVDFSPTTADINDVSVTQTELSQLEAIDATTISATQWGYLGAMGAQPIEALNNTAADHITLSGVTLSTALVDDNDIDWGTTAGEVSAVDLPIADAGTYYTGTEVETALQEIGADLSDVIDLNSWTGSTSITTLGTITTGTWNATPITSAYIGTDQINDTHVDWGTGANQVEGSDLPITDAGAYFDTDNVEAALQELGADIASGGDNWGSQVIISDAPLSGDGTTGSHLVIAQATTSTAGYLSSTDWNTFNGKQDALTFTASDFNGTTTISIDYTNGQAASTSTKGFLTAADWNTFNSKQGTITDGDALTFTGNTLNFDGGVTPSGELSGTWASPTIGINIIDYDNILYTHTLASNPTFASDESFFGTNGIIFEGTTANTFEGLLTITDPTADRTYTLPDASGNVILGSGVGSEIAYFTGTGVIGSLTTATYPSLTELSYVKGVTSAIQTQLDSKVPTTRTINGEALSSDVTLDLSLSTNTLSLTGDASTVDLSSYLDNATHTGDVTGATALTIAADAVDDTHINWGVGAGTVSAADAPIQDVGGYYDGSDIEAALQEIGADIAIAGDNWGSQVVESDATLSGTGITGNLLSVVNDGHTHTGSSISGLTTADFTSANISQWTNDANYLDKDIDPYLVDNTGNWAGTFQGQNGAYYLDNATHTGEVTGSGALTIATNIIDYDNILYTHTIGANPAFGASETFWGTTGIIFEGAVADNVEGLLTASPTSSDKTWTLPNLTGTVTLGSGTSNQLTYWSGANTVGALSTATYPSLTELSYVKGVTSAIQTQLNSKVPNTRTVNGEALSSDVLLDLDLSGNTLSLTGDGTTVSLASYLDNATHTGDVTGATVLTIGNDRVDQAHINWGVNSATLVGAEDIPIYDLNNNFTTDYVEDALEQLAEAGYITGNQSITLSGDATGSGTTAITVAVVDNSHNHTAATISGLGVADFTSANISQWTNDANYLDKDIDPYVTAEVDGSITNEGSLSVGAGTSTTSLIQSNTSGSSSVTLQAGSNVTISEAGNTITINAIQDGTGSDDQVASEVPISDVGDYYTGTEVESALQEIGAAGYISGNETITLTGDVTGSGTTSITTVVGNNSHTHTGSTISGLEVVDFTSPNISQWTNDANYLDKDTDPYLVDNTGNWAGTFQGQNAAYYLDNATHTGEVTGSAALTIATNVINYDNILYTHTIGSNPTFGAGETFWGTTGVIFEGATNNTYETLLTVADPTADRTATLPNRSGTITLGTGTANQLAYWEATNEIGQLSTATYPNLTEISYVKGVTSSIQTQLDNLAPSNATFLVTTASAGLSNEVVVGTTPSGDLGGTWDNISVDNNSHTHTASTISGLSPVDFTDQGVAQWTNDANYLDKDTDPYVTSEVDGSITNEGSLTVGSGTSTTSLINSNTSGSTAVTLSAGTNISLSEAGNTITINSTAGGVGGSGSSGYVTYWSGANTIAATGAVYSGGLFGFGTSVTSSYAASFSELMVKGNTYPDATITLMETASGTIEQTGTITVAESAISGTPWGATLLIGSWNSARTSSITFAMAGSGPTSGDTQYYRMTGNIWGPENSSQSSSGTSGAPWTTVYADNFVTTPEGKAKIPAGANPTTANAGEIAVDTDEFAIEVSDGSNSYLINTEYTVQKNLYLPRDMASEKEYCVMYVPSNTYPNGITIKSLHISTDVSVTSDTHNFEEWDSRNDATPATIEAVSHSGYNTSVTSGIDDTSIAAGAWIMLDLDAGTTASDWMEITVTYYINEGN